MLNYLKGSINDINLLEKDENIYAFSKIEGGTHHVRKGDDGKVYIETSSDGFSIHEIAHIRQSLKANGLIFDKNNLLGYADNKPATVAKSEVEAYRHQYSYDKYYPGSTGNKGLQGITPTSIINIQDEKGNYVYNTLRKYFLQKKD